jgi:hypothetical protein
VSGGFRLRFVWHIRARITLCADPGKPSPNVAPSTGTGPRLANATPRRSRLGCPALRRKFPTRYLRAHFVRMRAREGRVVGDAAVLGSRDRLRVVLLISLTTAAGLLPLLTEARIQAQVLKDQRRLRSPRLRSGPASRLTPLRDRRRRRSGLRARSGPRVRFRPRWHLQGGSGPR